MKAPVISPDMAQSELVQTERAKAKINLTLHVGRLITQEGAPFRGYHPLDSLVVFADAADELTAALAAATSLSITGPFAHAIDTSADNLILKAIAAVSKHTDVPPLSINLVKNLPVAAGIGGGSANAAAMLRLLRGYVDLPEDVWRETALSLGADVPVCMLSRTAHMSGIGEHVTPLDGLGQVSAVLVNPRRAVPTGAVFKVFDAQTADAVPLAQASSGTLLARALGGRNDLELPAAAHAPIISDVLRVLASQTGAALARMSGSGATCFALFERRAAAAAAARAIAQTHPDWWVSAAQFGEAS